MYRRRQSQAELDEQTARAFMRDSEIDFFSSYKRLKEVAEAQDWKVGRLKKALELIYEKDHRAELKRLNKR